MKKEELKDRCKVSIEKGLDTAKKYFPNLEILGIYGSGARYICMPKNEYDLNILTYGKLNKKAYRENDNTLIVLSIDTNIDPYDEYPTPAESLLPISAVLSHHSRCLNNKCKKIIKTIVDKLSKKDRTEIGKSMIYHAYKFLKNAGRGKDLTRALCDFLPYGELWVEQPNRIPSLEDNQIEKISPKQISDKCYQALEIKEKPFGEKHLKLAKESLGYIKAKYDLKELERSWNNVKKKMKPTKYALGGMYELGEI